MKKTILLLITVFVGLSLQAQLYEGINYKMLITQNGNVLANHSVNIKISIMYDSTMSSDTTWWIEEHNNVMTDDNGICSVVIGSGNRIGGTASHFYEVNFSTGLFGSMKYKVEVNAGSGYQTLVDWTKFEAVPLAKIAAKSKKLSKQYGTVEFSNSGKIQFDAGNNSINNYKIEPDASNRLSFSYNDIEIMYFQGGAYANFIKDVNMEGKLTAPDSGDNDLKPYAYGEWYSGSSRHTTDNVTITRLGTGQYKIEFPQSLGAPSNYIVIPQLYLNDGFIHANKSDDLFYIYTRNTSGNYADKDFTFVVFKK